MKIHQIYITTTLLGMLCILLGAFGAHALQDTLSATALKNFETGVRYQMFHVLALLFTNANRSFSEREKQKISYLFLGGIFLFSGSLYAITVGNIPAETIWFVTPLGGLVLMLGWLQLARTYYKKRRTSQ